MVTMAHPLTVPLQADFVLRPRLVYGGLPLIPAEGKQPSAAVYFRLEDKGTNFGRVTFEGLDAIRAARGEHFPYARSEPFTAHAWVFQVHDSPWLAERHEYENRHYKTPLLDSHQHYFFRFHDEFIEAVAQGIWFDRPNPEQLLEPPTAHPLQPFALSAPAESRRSPSGIEWELRRATTARTELLSGSVLCSQLLYQFNTVLDGASQPLASVWLRTSNGVTQSRMTRPWVGQVAEYEGFAESDEFLDPWERYLDEVAARRRASGRAARPI
jgi:hypothetical protein